MGFLSDGSWAQASQKHKSSYQWLDDRGLSRGFNKILALNISVWIFAATAIGVLLLAFLSVSYHTIKAALANPVRALKNE